MRQEKVEGMRARVPAWEEEALRQAPLGWTSSVEEETWTTEETEQSVWGGEQARDPALGQSARLFLCHWRESKYVGKMRAGQYSEVGNNGVMPFEGFWASLREGEEPAAGCEEVGASVRGLRRKGR